MRTVVAFLIASCCAFAQWTNVTSLSGGRTISVEKKGGTSVKGAFVRATQDAVVVSTKQQELSVARTEVVRIEVKGGRHAKWWGLTIGAGSGAAVGGAVGARIANESGGDFNFKGAAVAIVAAAGALIGLAIGAALDSRHSTIYHS